MKSISDNLFGSSLMAGSLVFYTVNDSFMKSLGDSIPFFQTILMRGAIVFLCLLIASGLSGALSQSIGMHDKKLIAIRSAAELAGTYFFLNALYQMPLANLNAIMGVLPLTVTIAAVFLFGEMIGWKRIFAITLGFFGMLLIVRPGAEQFNVYSFYALSAVVCVTVREMATRRLSESVPSLMVATVTAFSILVMGVLGSLTIDLQPVSIVDLGKLLGASTFLIGGYLSSVLAMRKGDIGFVAPFRYSGLIAAIIIGYFFFDEWPDIYGLLGIVIIIFAGIFTIYREQKMLTRRSDRL
ncbi:MAG: DMT family transporter [Proteobacteria bacterium]|nr:DMT family transporter [Pseudomonadota bacterium]MDA1237435.1 DMT family transporter [Pseudomonadota bacterium]